MTEHELPSTQPEEPTPESLRPRHRNDMPALPEWRPEEDSPMAALWREGYSRWGWAFAAYLTLQLPESRTQSVLTTFEDLYSGTFPSFDAVANMQIESLGWKDALDAFRLEQGIAEELLSFDKSAILDVLEEAYSMVVITDEVHLFAK